ncbi:glycosyltransferase [Edaphobacter dinghuensis]|uniref:Sugar transferase related protein n=1 Tax=Edaphobacter dinghuensis TaxID=1560005 RepID=A0A917H2K3_9BACT|nr:glycosyltransferase [Edaphobacter dinghuensis]GGG65521.1 sugar transferase related protein [Edaphobacter dinghuensis]
MAVSVIATVLNEVDEIPNLVASLTDQTLIAAEIVIVDGGSTDGTWEWLQNAKSQYPALIAIRDESCNLKQSPGPIARGRNVAIASASSDIIACADAGCTYRPDWLANLTAAIRSGAAEYALGGSCIDPASPTVWDIASAPFFGVKLNPNEFTKSCTARSMAFRKSLWQSVGGFPETVLLGEDTLFDAKVRKRVTPNFAECAKAFYRPRHALRSALQQLASYALADGALGIRPARLFRNVARCVVEVLALIALHWSPIPLFVILALENYFAFHFDWRSLQRASFRTLAARLVFSILVPWVVAWNQVKGSITKANLPNRQNAV